MSFYVIYPEADEQAEFENKVNLKGIKKKWLILNDFGLNYSVKYYGRIIPSLIQLPMKLLSPWYTKHT